MTLWSAEIVADGREQSEVLNIQHCLIRAWPGQGGFTMLNKLIMLFVSVWIGTVMLGVALVEGRGLSLDVKEFVCDEGHYRARCGVINDYTYDSHATIAFKILQDGKTVACKTVETEVTGGADGAEPMEVLFDAACLPGDVQLEYRIYERKQRNRMGPWLSDCPEPGPGE